MPLPDFTTLEPVSGGPDFDTLEPLEPESESIQSGLVSKQPSYFAQVAKDNFFTDPMGGEMRLVREPKTAAEGLFNALAKLGGSAISPFGVGATAAAPIRPLQPVLKGLLAGLGAKNLGEIYGELSVPQAQPKTIGGTIEKMGDITGAVGMTAAGLPEFGPKPLTKGVADAIKERIVQESVPTERAGDDALRAPTEPSPGSGVQPEAPVQAKAPVAPTPDNIQDWRPAIRLMPTEEGVPGKVVLGEKGQAHDDIIKSNNLKPEQIDKRGFSNGTDWADREQMAKATETVTGEKPTDVTDTGVPRGHAPDLEDAQEAAPTEPGKTIAEQKETPSGAPASIKEAFDQYDETGQIGTVQELAEHIEHFVNEGVAPKYLERALRRYQRALEEDYRMAGRGDVEPDEEKFMAAVEKAATAQPKIPKSPPTQPEAPSAGKAEGGGDVVAAPKPTGGKPTVRKSIRGEMHQVWVKLPGKPEIEVGTVEENPKLSNESEAVKTAERAWKFRELEKQHGTELALEMLDKPEMVGRLTPTESTRLKSLTEKLESGKPLTGAEQKRFRALKEKVSPPEPEQRGTVAGTGGELQMAIVPGAKEFVEQDVLPKLKEAGQTVGETVQQIKSTLSPPSMSSEGQLAAGIIREKKAQLAQKDVQAREAFAKAKRQMDFLSPQASLSFIDNIEQGRPQATPEGNALSTALRSEFDKRVAQVQALGTGKLQHVIQDYFPHIWKDPTAAVSWYARILGKRPLRGPASFLKRRTIPLTTDGVAAGLTPVTWNPVELSLLKMHEMDRYVMGQQIFQEFKDQGWAQFSRSDIPPAGYAKIDDRIANVVEYRPTTTKTGAPGAPERVLRGHWYAQEDAARVLNNFLSPGLENYKWFRALRWAGNTLNLAQLGLSGYHFTFTMLDSSTGKLALGIEQLSRGDVFKGAQNIARGIAGIPMVNQLEYFLKGSKVLKEYTKPGTVGGDYAQIVNALLAGGGRTEMPRIFKNNSLENFMTALRSGNYPGAVLRAPFAMIQAVSHPLMQVVVPRLKLGAFTDMARYEIEKMGPNVTREQFRKKMGEIWDSVDNRMGEMVYDNLFWNKTLKDTAFLGVRAVGWNLGTIRELGGGVADTATVINRLRKGDPLMTRKMTYTIALPITVGSIGAMYQYLKTGKGPSELKDYFYPKTGKTLPDGTPERVNFPSYLKDIYAYTRHPGQTIINKLHPMWSMMHQMWTNKDYYGAQIRNPDDPLVKQVGEELNFVTKQFLPFSVRGAERRAGAKESPEIKAESFMGIIPIPPEIARTPAQNKIMEYGTARMGQGGKTVEEQQRLELKRDIEAQIKSPEDYGKAREELQRLRREGKLSRGQALYEQGKLRFEAQQQSAGLSKAEAQWLWRFRHLTLPEMRNVYEMSTPQEKRVFERTLRLKERNQ